MRRIIKLLRVFVIIFSLTILNPNFSFSINIALEGAYKKGHQEIDKKNPKYLIEAFNTLKEWFDFSAKAININFQEEINRAILANDKENLHNLWDCWFFGLGIWFLERAATLEDDDPVKKTQIKESLDYIYFVMQRKNIDELKMSELKKLYLDIYRSAKGNQYNSNFQKLKDWFKANKQMISCEL